MMIGCGNLKTRVAPVICKCYTICMNTYKVTVAVEVEVESFDESDAVDLVEDAFGTGDYSGYKVTKFVVRNIQES